MVTKLSRPFPSQVVYWHLIVESELVFLPVPQIADLQKIPH